MDGLARDIQVSFGSVRSWLAIFESFFLFFRLSPWTSRVSRAILKEKKPYFFDVGRVTDPAARFENLVALELFRATAQWTEWGRGDFTLHYLRNRDGEEVDFLVADGRRPLFLVEAKLGDEAPAKALLGFQSILGLPAVQVVEKPGVCRLIPNGSRKILVVSADRWLATLP
jgi:predicted AAA+ superfamily ATPase